MLAACGGGGGGSASGSSNTTSPDAVTTLKSYDDGSGVLAVESIYGSSADVPTNVLIGAPDLTAAREIALGTVNLEVVPGSASQSGPFYVVTRRGTASNGASLEVATVGENLNLSGTEYASISLVTADGELGIISGGTPLDGIPSDPSGPYTYTGNASVFSTATNVGGDGTFTLTADFSNNTGTLAATVPANSSTGANNPEFFFSSNDLKINPSDGGFSSSNALIGQSGVTSNAASVNGYFAGKDAAGVHGVVYTNDPTAPAYGGAFYGSR